MTRMPALLSSAARMPPAPPTPTMTISVFSVAILRPAAQRFGLRLQSHHRRAGEGLFALELGLTELRLRAREADKPPAREVLVAAIDRVGEHAFHGVSAQRVEKTLRTRPGKAFCLPRFQRGDHRVLLCRRRQRETGIVGFAAIGIELNEPVAIKFLLV